MTKKYVVIGIQPIEHKAVLNADSKELRNDIAGAVSVINFSGGDFLDYEFDVLTAGQFSKIKDII